jgi:alpha-beta hydrolase superfamily lysophospholipase
MTGRAAGVVRFLYPLATLVQKIMILKDGADTPGIVEYNMIFKGFNKPFLPSQSGTDYAWLNRDLAGIRRWVDDPWCGFISSKGMWLEISRGERAMWKPANERKIPATLPVLILSGTKDPVNNFLKDLQPLVARYKEKLGIKDLTTKYYQDARHDIIFELNHDDVWEDILSWLNGHVK